MAGTLDKSLINSFIPTIVAQKAITKLPTPVVLVPFINNDYSNEVAQKGDVVRIAKNGALSAQNKTANTAVTLQNNADSEVLVTLNQHKEVSMAIEDIARAESSPDVFAGYVQDAVITILESMETYAFTVAQGLSAITGTAYDNALDLAEITLARKTLTDNRAPIQNRGLFLSTEEYSNVLTIANIDQNQMYGGNQAIAEGRVPRVRGFDVFESILVQAPASPTTGFDNLAIHKDALAIAARALPVVGAGYGVDQFIINMAGLPIRVTYGYDASYLAKTFTVDALFGCSILRSELGYVMKS